MTAFIKGTKHTAANIRTLAEYINHEFTWATTTEGRDYWNEVQLKLKRISSEAGSKVFVKEGGKLEGVETKSPLFVPVIKTTKIIHVYYQGKTLCNILTRPSEWPKDHERVSLDEANHTNCVGCLFHLTAMFLRKTTK